MLESLLPPLQRGVLQGGVVLLIGVAAWKLVIGRALSRPSGRGESAAGGVEVALAIGSRATRIAVVVLVALIAAWALGLYTQMRAFRDPFVPLREDLALLLTGTPWGPVWMAQGMVVGLVLIALLLVSGPGRVAGSQTVRSPSPAGPGPRDEWIVGIGAFLLAISLTLSSHAMSVESGKALAVAGDFAHTVAAGCWIGLLAVIVATTVGAGNMAASTFSIQIRAFSPFAQVAVPVLLAAGVLLAVFHLTSVSDLWTTAYGRILLAKVGTALLVMLLGLWNWRRGIPRIDEPAVLSAVRRRGGLEVLVAVVVLALTAVLTGTSLP